MARVALLVWMGDAEPGLNSRPPPRPQNRVKALQEVLQHPEMGRFTEVKTLIDPERKTLEAAIATLFAACEPYDLVLLYFCGQGFKNEQGELYLAAQAAAQTTDKSSPGTVQSAVPASLVQDSMNRSRSKQQVMILDCCFSPAFAKTQSAQAENSEDIAHQLGGYGRVILTSSTQSSSEPNQAECPAYTRYLIEGLKTGAADLDNDGVISIEELHEYTSRKVQKLTPVVKPEIYWLREDKNKIVLAKAPIHDPKLKYRKEVERCASCVEVIATERSRLDRLRDRLGLLPEQAAAIEVEVLKPEPAPTGKRQQCEQATVKALQPATARVSTPGRFQLKKLLRLKEDITALAARTPRRREAVRSTKQTKFPQAQKTFHRQEITPDQPKEAVAVSKVRTLSVGTVDFKQSTPSHPIQSNPWLQFGGGIAIFLAVIGAVHALWQRQDWQASQQLQPIKLLAEARNYQDCINQAPDIPESSDLYTEAQALLQLCQAGANWQNVQVQTLPAHSDTAWSVALSPDGQTFASGSADQTIKLWNLQTGKQLRTLSGHSGYVYSAAISPDGQTLTSGSADRTIKLWNPNTGKLVRTLAGHSDSVWSVAISPDGQTLASGSSDKTVKLWSLRTGKLLQTLSGHSDWIFSVAFGPDGRTLASASKDGTVKLWNLRTGRLLQTLSGHTDPARTVAFSPDGQTLASGGWDKTIKLWSLRTGSLINTLAGHSDSVISVAFSPDSQTLASASKDRTIKLWNLQTKSLINTLAGHSNWLLSVSFSPDGRILVSSSKDRRIKVWRR